jgi:protein O-GlcNAc transferase
MQQKAYDKSMYHIRKAERLVSRGRLKDSISLYRRGLKIYPENPDVLNNFANVLTSLNRLDEAIKLFKKAIQYAPDSPEAYANLGSAYASKGQFYQAIAECKRALTVDPAFDGVYALIGLWLSKVGQNKEALEALQQAINKRPHDRWVFSLYLLIANYSDILDKHSLFKAHQKWYSKFFIHHNMAQDIGTQKHQHKPLNIAYVSADFRHHSVAFFIEAILKGHNRTKFKVFVYSNNSKDDQLTQRLKKSVDAWHSIIALNDTETCNLIRNDKIDILVDLSGHFGGNRLPVFAQKPAPIQITYLGYPNTTGMDVMDYRITDSISDPVNITDDFYSESLIRLNNGFLCYTPPDNSPDIPEEPPCVRNDVITFGSFNNLAKLSPTTIRLWATILRSIPDSQLVLKSKAFEDPQVNQYLYQQFEAHDIRQERIKLHAYAENFTQHMALYNEIDIALDTFPYNGTTTTFEALWMGVPVVSLAGETHLSRVGMSILTILELNNLIAENEADFIDAAQQLATNITLLSQYRNELRTRLQSSPLMDRIAFVNKLETAYMSIWEKRYHQ